MAAVDSFTCHHCNSKIEKAAQLDTVRVRAAGVQEEVVRMLVCPSCNKALGAITSPKSG